MSEIEMERRDDRGLLVVGSVAYDSIATPAGAVDDALGGSATFFSIAASRFKAPQLVAVVGADFADADAEIMRARGVCLEGLQKVDGKTFRWGGRYHDDMNGRDTLFTELNVFESFSPELPSSYRDARHVFLANIDPELQLRVLDQISHPDFVACDTMNFWINGPKREALERVFSRVDCILINDEEATLYTGQKSVVAAARALQKAGPSVVIIKQGPHGAWMFNGSQAFHVPAVPLDEVIDPTGAGDTFAGGFMGFLAASKERSDATLRAAAVAGTVLASFSVEGFGVSRLVDVQRDDLVTRCDTLCELARITRPEF